MYTVTITYRDDTMSYYEVKSWKLQGRYFCIEYGKEHYDFIPTDKVIRINVMKNN